MQNNAFQPFGPTVLVTNGPVQVLTTNGMQATSYRVRNLTTTNAYVAWGPALNSGATPAITAVAPTLLSVSVTNTIGMVASSVEVFVLPNAAWFNGSAGGTFEVTPGEGI